MVRPTMECVIISQERPYKDGAPHHEMMLSFCKRGPIRMVHPTMDILICNISRAMSRLFFLSILGCIFLRYITA